MIDQTQKLEKFKQAVFDDAAANAEELISGTEKECSELIREAEREAVRVIRTAKEAADSEYNAAALRKASSGRLEAKRRVLLCREEIIEKVFDSVRQQLEDYRKTAEYEKLMIQMAEECARKAPGKKGRLLISPKDSALKDRLTAGGSFEVALSDSIVLGGVMAVFSQDNLALDMTFDNSFAAQRKGFAGKAGLVI